MDRYLKVQKNLSFVPSAFIVFDYPNPSDVIRYSLFIIRLKLFVIF